MAKSSASPSLKLSIAFYVFSLITPAFTYHIHSFSNPQYFFGWQALVWGPVAIIFCPEAGAGLFSWLSNPLIWVAWLGIFNREKALSTCTGAAAILFSLLFFSIREIPTLADTWTNLTLNIGYILWILSMICALVASSRLEIPSKKFASIKDGNRFVKVQIDGNSNVKIKVDLPNRSAILAESLWAKHLGDGNYQVKNIPFCAYGLNLNDIVFARVPSNGEMPLVINLVEAKGHKTLRIIFTDDGTKEEHIQVVEALRTNYITYERNNSGLYSFDVAPGGEFSDLFNALKDLETKMILKVETCEARNANGFDDILIPVSQN